jgi:hypothetical protein
MTPVKQFSINFGAPSDYKDEEGKVWFAYPNPNTHYNNQGNQLAASTIFQFLKDNNLLR